MPSWLVCYANAIIGQEDAINWIMNQRWPPWMELTLPRRFDFLGIGGRCEDLLQVHLVAILQDILLVVFLERNNLGK